MINSGSLRHSALLAALLLAGCSNAAPGYEGAVYNPPEPDPTPDQQADFNPDPTPDNEPDEPDEPDVGTADILEPGEACEPIIETNPTCDSLGMVACNCRAEGDWVVFDDPADLNTPDIHFRGCDGNVATEVDAIAGQFSFSDCDGASCDCTGTKLEISYTSRSPLDCFDSKSNRNTCRNLPSNGPLRGLEGECDAQNKGEEIDEEDMDCVCESVFKLAVADDDCQLDDGTITLQSRPPRDIACCMDEGGTEIRLVTVDEGVNPKQEIVLNRGD